MTEIEQLRYQLEVISEADFQHKELRHKLSEALEAAQADLKALKSHSHSLHDSLREKDARWAKLVEENKWLDAEIARLKDANNYFRVHMGQLADREPNAGEARGMTIDLGVKVCGQLVRLAFRDGLLMAVHSRD